ncbi:hypothetical protein [Apilactobacillus micheneri]|uniref:hypothetical protein n=1 Tax=Apilactobacillus micheneri TaxID=1899430 RepID=UPI0011290B8C|nr:hypothetical protein [Apilactobacillus micheneri]TPR40444.1 hypothetical protein DY119_01770 [Apilactobacillus micheneri]
MKKIILIFMLVLILIGGYIVYDQEGIYSTSHQFNKIIRYPNKRIKKYCINSYTFNYIKSHDKQKLKNIIDNQGSEDVFYYVATYINKKIGIYGKINESGFHLLMPSYKVKKIIIYK